MHYVLYLATAAYLTQPSSRTPWPVAAAGALQSTGAIPAAARPAALLCVPMLAVELLPDWEAMSVGSADEWADGAWWTLWGDGDGGSALDMLPCLERAALREEAAQDEQKQEL